MHLVEQVGSGINRMNDLMEVAGLPLPEFRTDGMFTVKLLRSKETVEETVEKTVEKTSAEKIIEAISNNSLITTNEMMKYSGLSRRGVEYQLDKLKKAGILDRIGGDKGGYWIILDKK